MKKKTTKYADSYVILNDGETFMPTTGTIVIEHGKINASITADLDSGDPRTLHEAVENGKVKGRILNVEALIALYDTVMVTPDEMVSPDITARANAVEA